MDEESRRGYNTSGRNRLRQTDPEKIWEICRSTTYTRFLV